MNTTVNLIEINAVNLLENYFVWICDTTSSKNHYFNLYAVPSIVLNLLEVHWVMNLDTIIYMEEEEILSQEQYFDREKMHGRLYIEQYNVH
jgi:hypothetical protein